jgi:hypothetical protein
MTPAAGDFGRDQARARIKIRALNRLAAPASFRTLPILNATQSRTPTIELIRHIR